jgi:urease accessory protein
MECSGLTLMVRTNWPWTLLAGVALALAPMAAWAHADPHPGGGFVAGFLHPISGLDHVVAMVAVGLWSAVLGPPALWVLPVAFPMVMAFGVHGPHGIRASILSGGCRTKAGQISPERA